MPGAPEKEPRLLLSIRRRAQCERREIGSGDGRDRRQKRRRTIGVEQTAGPSEGERGKERRRGKPGKAGRQTKQVGKLKTITRSYNQRHCPAGKDAPTIEDGTKANAMRRP